MKREPKGRLNIRLPQYEIEAFKAWCDAHNREYSATIGTLIHRLIMQQKPKRREPTEVHREPIPEVSMPMPEEIYEEKVTPMPEDYSIEYEPEHPKMRTLKKRRDQ